MKRAFVMSLLVLLGTAACNPQLFAQSVAPPGRQATLEAIDGFWGVKAYRVELSQGVALAITCHQGGPCKRMKVVASDPAIADVRRASLGNLEPRHAFQPTGHQTSSSGFVLLGKQPGTTQLKLTTEDGERTVYVTIVAPPPNPAATRAAVL